MQKNGVARLTKESSKYHVNTKIFLRLSIMNGIKLKIKLQMVVQATGTMGVVGVIRIAVGRQEWYL